MLFIECVNYWFENKVKLFLKYKTIITYKNIIVKYLTPYFKNLMSYNLSNENIYAFIAQLSNNGLSNNYIYLIFSILKQIIKFNYKFINKKKLNLNYITLPKKTIEPIRAFSWYDQLKIQNYILERKLTKYYGIIIVLYTGLRIGELLSLKWEDINFKEKYMIITRTVTDGYDEYGKHTHIFSSPKSECSNRKIYIPDKILEFLKELKRKSNSFYVISKSKEPKFIRCYQDSYKRLLSKIGIKYKNFHALRHTFATRAIERGIDYKTLSNILGHKSVNITLNIYVDSTEYLKQKAVTKMNYLLS